MHVPRCHGRSMTLAQQTHRELTVTKQDHPAKHDKERHGSKGDEKYTEPELRAKLKDEVQKGDKGGKPGQWSARKSQLLVHEYEKQGGGYTTEERTDDQKHLEQWQDEEWTTADGKPAERDDVMHRYLPKEAWEKMSAKERREADAEKVEGSKGGVQYVANPKAAREARKEVSKEHDRD